MNSRFQTLLLREWMQHKRGWLITLFLPIGLFLVLLPFGQVDGNPDGPPLEVALAMMAFTSLGVFSIAWISAMFQLPGLARRDVQDRSIEFWLSLPASHAESVAAPLLAHGLLVPIAGLLVGACFGPLVAAGLMVKLAGFSAFAAVPWGTALAAVVPVVLRGLLGVVLMSLWLAPLLLITMVASAWLKRWGIPAVALVVGVGGLVLDKVYGLTIVWDLLNAQTTGASAAFVADPDTLGRQVQTLAHQPKLPLEVAAMAWHDGLRALQDLASPHFIGGLIVAAACFALLVYKRSQSH